MILSRVSRGFSAILKNEYFECVRYRSLIQIRYNVSKSCYKGTKLSRSYGTQVAEFIIKLVKYNFIIDDDQLVTIFLGKKIN